MTISSNKTPSPLPLALTNPEERLLAADFLTTMPFKAFAQILLSSNEFPDVD